MVDDEGKSYIITIWIRLKWVIFKKAKSEP